MLPGVAHFIVGGRDDNGLYLYDIFPDGSLTEVDTFVASGSGSVIAYGLLETAYKKEMNVKAGVDLAVQAVNAALQRDSASGNGIDAVTITKEAIQFAFQKELQTRV